ncbi:MAG: hypothetical protein LBT12_01490, partial [Oscillospiraceae bacterium]|jgi:hypothetical protein|nr:hypothetical protein [Oscillospiraceae bacterium]
MSPEGIGGDDRAGVFAILEIIKNARCHVLFCEDEETGGRGAREFARRKLKPKVSYIVELDRRGGNDAVFYDCDNPAFTEFVLGFGFELAQGSFSDISILAPPLKLAAVNISAGYYNEHTRYEVINLAETRDVIARVARMASSPSERFEYKEKAWIPSFFDLRYPDHGQAPGGSRAQRAPKAGCTKRLMPLSDAAHLQMGGNLIEPEPGAYMMDGAGKVYEYLPELDAAVLTEDAEAFSVSGLPLRFSSDKAQKTRVLPFETAWELLEMRQ